jgi:hypothetical protein
MAGKFLHVRVTFNNFAGIGGKPVFPVGRIALEVEPLPGTKVPWRQIEF